MADEAFNERAVAEREMGSGSTSKEDFEAYLDALADLSPEDREAILAMSNEQTGPSTVVPMAPINPGAFGGLPSNAEMQTMDPAMRAMSAERTGPPTMMTEKEMMEYIQRKADDIKSRMGGRQPEGSVDDYLKTMAVSEPKMRPIGSGSTSEDEYEAYKNSVQMMRGTK